MTINKWQILPELFTYTQSDNIVSSNQLITFITNGKNKEGKLVKRDDVNAILNTSMKTARTVFSASNRPIGVTLLPELPDSHSKLP